MCDQSDFRTSRNTDPPEIPDALTDAFVKDQEKQRQWHAFVESVAHEPGDLKDVITEIAAFLTPHVIAAVRLRK
ncbi:hypothetical protein DQ393_30190 [Rhizobium tropici]|uniref:Uncharacterized protein n=1 Tax=Rhizobium tropici TaxID=398 RepID=A0A329YBC1_RHITR|nr:hypothetical protein DQ393_30330 [Rhizobium tropici]RAX37780.1 hypothetical protein DQ393_30190 [Rhizobium tropici]